MNDVGMDKVGASNNLLYLVERAVGGWEEDGRVM